MSSLFLVATFFALAIGASAQLVSSSARDIQTEVQKADSHVEQVIERANDHFRKGNLALDENKPKLARSEFDQAIDEILISGLDVRASERLNLFYFELVERIYNEEVPLTQPQLNSTPVIAIATVQSSLTPNPVMGFKEQKVNTTSDRLSKPLAVAPNDAILVQGFWMGMNIEDAQLPTAKRDDMEAITEDDIHFGLHKYSFNRSELNLRGTEAARTGATLVSLTFFDRNLSGISVAYDRTVEFRDIGDFAATISRALKMPSNWTFSKIRFPNATASLKHGHFDFLIIYSKTMKALMVFDDRTEPALKKRRADEIAAKRREFKP